MFAARSFPNTAPWILDSGASHHITADSQNIASPHEYTGPEQVSMGDGNDPNLVVRPNDSTAPAIVMRPPSELSAIQRNQQQHSPQLNLPSQTNQSLPPRRPVTRSQYQITKPNPKYASMATLTSQIPPVTVKQACKDPQWRQAIQSEFDALMSNQTWNLIPPSDHQNIVENKWIFCIKRKPDGSIERYKARLVVKGFTQRPGIDYVDTFSPVVKPTTIQIVLAIATQNKWPLHQLDINNVFLQDDIVITGNNLQTINNIKSALSNRFSLKDLGPLLFFPGIEVLPQSAGLFLSQTKYIMDILQEFFMKDCQGVYIPLSTPISLRLNDGSPPTDAKQYRSAIGKLQYLAFTRPDISFVVNKLSQFMHQPSHTHWQAVKRLLRYLKSTIHHGLLFHHGSNAALHVYTDADWAGDHDNQFPTLENLSIRNCPELSLETPIQLSSLKRFEVVGCPKVGVVFDDAELLRSQIEELRISDCNSVTSFPFSILPTTLKTITISRCQKLKLEQPVGEMSMFLEDLKLHECDCIDDISHLRARSLSVYKCHNLTRILIPTVTERLHIWGFENVEKLSVACGGTQMTSLIIWECWKLKCLPERMQELLPSLKYLRLWDCPEIESFPEGGLPFNLQQLHINKCKKLVNGRKEWHLQRLPCLRELWINHDGSDEEILGAENWELPSSIHTLNIWNLKTLSSQHLKSLTSLQHLHIEGNLHQIQSMLEQGQFLHLTSLQSLEIMKFPNLQSLPESALPSSLSQLTIYNCPKLQSLPESALPSSLSQLIIDDCPNLQSLPVKGMPSSLSKLYISECPLLTPLLEFDKGEYWPEIAHISTIEIDWKCL
ncbi:uncharacterized protein LOC125844514 [Solanum stenotomum]|uniref:uncharacterized protein LOC125844514 n=1 Tax=Solanum stenotomum TaxID=172797 RepID=UPI0020D15D28|nr:uncharacterized protein LOC125844514 [Solanum stenotomum]